MNYTLVRIDCNLLLDWESFHDTFVQEFGFPDFYGRNMNGDVRKPNGRRHNDE